MHALALARQICRHGETRNGMLPAPAAVPDAQRKAHVFHAPLPDRNAAGIGEVLQVGKNDTNDYYLCYICTGVLV